MVHGIVLVFHIQIFEINWNFISGNSIFGCYTLATFHYLPTAEKLQSSHICRCVTDSNTIYLCSNMFYR